MNSDHPKIFLQTGDCFFGVMPTMVTTVLGSCVAVTMHCPQRQIGAICHAFLPDETAGKGTKDPQVCRFVDSAIYSMLDGMDRLNVPRHSITVKVFGGASGIATSRMMHSTYNIGRRNVETAKRILKEERLHIETMDVGGNQGRKLHFLTSTGDIWMKRLRSMDVVNHDAPRVGRKI